MAPKNLKRVRQGEEWDATEARVPEQSLVEKFSELSKKLGSPEAAVLSLMRFFSVEIDSIKSPFPDKLASFSNAEYAKIAPFFNMNPESVHLPGNLLVFREFLSQTALMTNC
jgi:hypothetical protein